MYKSEDIASPKVEAPFASNDLNWVAGALKAATNSLFDIKKVLLSFDPNTNTPSSDMIKDLVTIHKIVNQALAKIETEIKK